jgi:hypothetical protein
MCIRVHIGPVFGAWETQRRITDNCSLLVQLLSRVGETPGLIRAHSFVTLILDAATHDACPLVPRLVNA